MREALARADYDFTLAEEAAPRAPARERAGGARAARRPAGRAEGSRSRIAFWLMAALRRPGRSLAAVIGLGIVSGVVLNALWLQTAPHPAPLFSPRVAPAAPQAAASVEPQPASRAQAPAPQASPALASAPQASAPPASSPHASPIPRAASAPAPVRETASLSTPRSAPPVTAPLSPPRPTPRPDATASTRKPDEARNFDPIAQFLRQGAPPTQSRTAAASPSTSEAAAGGTRRVQGAQRALARLGHPIEADGLMGPATRAAIQKFERDHKLPVTGEINPRTLRELASRSGVAIP